MKIDRTTIVSAEEVGECLGVVPSRVRQLVQEGVVVKHSHGKYRLVETLENHRAWMKSGTANDEGENLNDLPSLKRAKAEEEVRALKRENDKADGLLIEIETIKSDFGSLLSVISDITLNLKLRIKRLQPDMPDRVSDLIDRECSKALKAICQLDDGYTRESEK